ncbi:hypothetical protein [Spongorhabdus nitratireducens]
MLKFIRNIVITGLLLITATAQASPGKGFVFLLSTQAHYLTGRTELQVVMVTNPETGSLELPGGEILPGDGGLHFSPAIRAAAEQLGLKLGISDITNLNRSYTWDNKTVYFVGDETCRDLFLLDGRRTPTEGYYYPWQFDRYTLMQEQSRRAVVGEVEMVPLRLIISGLASYQPDSSRTGPGAFYHIDDPDVYGKSYILADEFMYMLSQAKLIECPQCTASGMLELMSAPYNRAQCKQQLAHYFGYPPEWGIAAPTSYSIVTASTSDSGSTQEAVTTTSSTELPPVLPFQAKPLVSAIELRSRRASQSFTPSSVSSRPDVVSPALPDLAPPAALKVSKAQSLVVHAGRDDKSYWLTSGNKPPAKTDSGHDIAPYFRLFDKEKVVHVDRDSGFTTTHHKEIESRTIAFVDCGIMSVAELINSHIANQPEVMALLQGIHSCRVMIHAQTVPDGTVVHKASLHPGSWLATNRCRLEVGLEGQYSPHNIPLKSSKSQSGQLSDSFVYMSAATDGLPEIRSCLDDTALMDFQLRSSSSEVITAVSVIKTDTGRKDRGYDVVLTLHRLYSSEVASRRDQDSCLSAATFPCQIASVAWGDTDTAVTHLMNASYKLASYDHEWGGILRFQRLDQGTLLTPLTKLPEIFTGSGLFELSTERDSSLDSLLTLACSEERKGEIVVAIEDEEEDEVAMPPLQRLLKPLIKYRMAGDFSQPFDIKSLLAELAAEGEIGLPAGGDQKLCSKFESHLRDRGTDIKMLHVYLENYIRFLASDDEKNMVGGYGPFQDFNPLAVDENFDISERRKSIHLGMLCDCISQMQLIALDSVNDLAELNRRYNAYCRIHSGYQVWIERAASKHFAGYGGMDDAEQSNKRTHFAEMTIIKIQGKVPQLLSSGTLDDQQISTFNRYIRENEPQAAIELMREYLGLDWTRILEI